MTKTNRSSVAQILRRPSSRSFQLKRGARGRKSGFTKPMMVTVPIYIAAARMPGSTPAMNNLPMSCSVMMP